MGEMPGLSRRAFVFGSAAVAGGVAFGSYGQAQQAPSSAAATNPLAADLGPNSVTFNPWVEISPERITLIAQHADIGQGVGSIQPLMIAEELDLEPASSRSASPDPAPPISIPASRTKLRHSWRRTKAPRPRRRARLRWNGCRQSGLQMTGGSSTIPDTYEKLRMAGAIARETLKAAAAKRSGVAVADFRTEAGNVILPDGTKIPYVALSAEAAKITPVTDVKLRDPSQWRLIGKPMERLDIRAKVTGEMKFGIDRKMDGMVYAAVKLNPNKGQPIKSYDASKAQSMPGVQKILKISNGVAVIATNSWYAMQAAELVDCVWEPSKYPAEQAEHWNIVRILLHPGIPRQGVAQRRRYRRWFERRRRWSRRSIARPMSAISRWSRSTASASLPTTGMEIWVGHQTPQSVQYIAANSDRHEARTGHLP